MYKKRRMGFFVCGYDLFYALFDFFYVSRVAEMYDLEFIYFEVHKSEY